MGTIWKHQFFAWSLIMHKSITAVLLAVAPAASAQYIVNPDFETGSFAPWSVVPTANGSSVSTTLVTYDIDGPGPASASKAASFCVGRNNPSTTPGGITISQTIHDPGGLELRVSVDWSVRAFVNVYNASGGLFELLFDGQVIGQATAPVLSPGQAVYGQITGTVQVPIGDHSVAVRITRTVLAGEEVFQYLDNIIVTPTCHANCDGSSGSPTLTANDFQCFINAFAAGQSYANCDGVGGLTANDFQCFINEYAAGCS
jgi:hypothetical protein